MPIKRKKKKAQVISLAFKNGELTRDQSDSSDSPPPTTMNTRKRRPAPPPPQSTEEEDNLAVNASDSSASGGGDTSSVSSAVSQQPTPAAPELHGPAGQSQERQPGDFLLSLELQLEDYAREMMQVAQQRVGLGPPSLSNEEQRVVLAERHRQLHILATQASGLISLLKGGEPTFDSDRDLSTCLPRPRGEWQARSYEKPNQPSPISNRSPSDTSAFSMASFSQNLEAIPSSSMTGTSSLSPQTGVIPSSSPTNVFSSSSSQKKTQSFSPLRSHAQEANQQQSEPTLSIYPDSQHERKTVLREPQTSTPLSSNHSQSGENFSMSSHTSRPRSRKSKTPSLTDNEKWRGEDDRRPMKNFLLLLDTKMIADEIAEEDKWRILANSSKDVGFLEWLRLNIFQLEPKPSWEQCCELLLREFASTQAAHEARTEFMELRQPEGVGQGASTLRRAAILLAQCNDKNGDFTKEYVVYYTIKHVLNTKYRRKLTYSFDDCYKFDWKRLQKEVKKFDDLFLLERGQGDRRGQRHSSSTSVSSSSSSSRPRKSADRAPERERKTRKLELKQSTATSSSYSQPYRQAARSSSSYSQSRRPTAPRDHSHDICWRCQKRGHRADECRSDVTAKQEHIQAHIRRLYAEQQDNVSVRQVRELQERQKNGNLPHLSSEEQVHIRRLHQENRKPR